MHTTLEKKYLHVTEAMGGGVVTLLKSLASAQSSHGVTIEILFTVRPETPSRKELEGFFGGGVLLTPVEASGSLLSLFALMVKLCRCLRANQYEVVHLHSSWAGVVGRLAAAITRTKSKIFYSPHGFAFLRTNKSRVVRWLTLLTEKALSRVGNGLISTSQSEASLARSKLRANRIDVLQTGIDLADIGPRQRPHTSTHVTVVMVGRITYQKAPWRFGDAARNFGHLARFIWIGGGPSNLAAEWLGSSPVEITGWLSPDVLKEYLALADIIFFPTLWEGMSLALMQAQGMGIPAVVSDAIGNVDSVLDGVTGYVCSNERDMHLKLERLIRDRKLRDEMSEACIPWARNNLSDARIGRDSIAIYNQ